MRKLWIILFCLVLLSGGNAAFAADPSIEAYLIPWEVSAAETAAADGTLHFYFMAGEGMVVNPNSASSAPEKWGDSCLVAFPNGQLMLIDAGMPKYAPVLIENLRRLGVEKLDYLVITHPHDDHAGGVYTTDGLLDHIAVGQAFTNGVYNTNWSDPRLTEKVLEQHNIPHQAISEGFTLDIGEVHLQVISPSPETVGTELNAIHDINNTSLVMRMDYRDFSALFTADIYQAKEMELIRDHAELLDVDLLKMPHHGNATSNTKDFAQAVSPVLAVATGRNILQAMQYYNYTKTGSKVLFDYCDGYIHVYTDGSELNWEQSRERETDFYDKYEYENLRK